MNKIKTFTLASLLGLAGFAGGFATEATAGIVVNDKQGSDGAIIAVLNPADQGAEHPGDAVGAKSGGGEISGFHWGVNPGNAMPTDQKGITDGTMPTDQKGGFVQGAYGDLLGRNAGRGAPGELVPAVIPNDGDAAGRKAGGLASLKGIGSTNNLFSNSKGGDQGNALLLPAVQKVREAARGEADGSVKPGDAQGLNFTNSGDTKGLNFSNPGAAKGLNFTNNANNAVGGTGAPKSLNFTATARK